MGDTGKDLVLEVREYLFHRLPVFRTRRRNLCGNVSGLDLRTDRLFLDRGEIISHPIGQGVSVFAELLKIHTYLYELLR